MPSEVESFPDVTNTHFFCILKAANAILHIPCLNGKVMASYMSDITHTGFGVSLLGLILLGFSISSLCLHPSLLERECIFCAIVW